MELAFVLARGQNAFFPELVEALRDELDELGVESSVHLDEFPEQQPGRVNVLVPPHEFFALRGHAVPPDGAPLERTVYVCAEQPGTHFFNLNVNLSPRAGAVFDINPLSLSELRMRNVRAELLPLGWTRRWDGTPFDPVRSLDVSFLGCWTPRRGRVLAAAAPQLARRRCHIRLSDFSRPNSERAVGFVTGAEKRALLGRTKLLLNVHQDDLPYLEWLRFVEGVLCGAVVVSEHSTYTQPFEPGTHFVSGSPQSLGLLVDALLDDEERRLAMQAEAYAALRERPFAQAVAALAERAAEVDRRRPPAAVGSGVSMAGLEAPVFHDDDDRFFVPPNITHDPDASALRRAVKDLKLELLALRREVDELRRPGGAPAQGVLVDGFTPAWHEATPRVTVLVTSYCYEDVLERALDSAAGSTFEPFEIVIVDDASRDASLARARAWLRAHPTLPALLVRHSANRGLGRARNTGVDFARGEYAFILDADNALYPHGLERLVAALDDDPAADFAYGLLEQFTGEGPFGVMNTLPWEPKRLRAGNYIDAMALVRTRTLRELPYTTDPRLHGYEDWDLWCAIAERGGHGVLVREIVARYRLAQHSMVRSTCLLSLTDVYSVLAERHPRLYAGVVPPL